MGPRVCARVQARLYRGSGDFRRAGSPELCPVLLPQPPRAQVAPAPPETGPVAALACSSACHSPKFSKRALWQEAHRPLGGPQSSRQQGPNVGRAATSWVLGWAGGLPSPEVGGST